MERRRTLTKFATDQLRLPRFRVFGNSGKAILRYKLSSPLKAKAVVINNNFGGDKDEKARDGSDVDVDNLRVAFENFGFTVELHEDVTQDHLFSIVDETVAWANCSDPDMLVLAIMTHGEMENGVDFLRMSDDTVVELYRVIERLSNSHCPGLCGKPKFFIVQACRGSLEDHGALVTGGRRFPEWNPLDQLGWTSRSASRHSDDTSSPDSPDCPDIPDIFVPSLSDILIAKATSPGYQAFRTPRGSWFISCLVRRLVEPVSRDVHTSLLLANNDVSRNSGKHPPGDSNCMQPSCKHHMLQAATFISSMRKELNLNKLAKKKHKNSRSCCCLHCRISIESRGPPRRRPFKMTKKATV